MQSPTLSPFPSTSYMERMPKIWARAEPQVRRRPHSQVTIWNKVNFWEHTCWVVPEQKTCFFILLANESFKAPVRALGISWQACQEADRTSPAVALSCYRSEDHTISNLNILLCCASRGLSIFLRCMQWPEVAQEYKGYKFPQKTGLLRVSPHIRDLAFDF